MSIFYDVENEIIAEAEAAQAKFGDFTSSHEALGVLAEEMAELVEAIRLNSLEDMRHEAIQVSAVAMRLAEHCRNRAAFAARSGC